MKLKNTYLSRRLQRLFFTITLAGVSQLALADSEYASGWGPGIGSTAPLLSALDQDGQPQDLQSLKGANGLLFVFNRSVDW